MTFDERVYDQYAAAALQGLVSKLPLVDRDGEFSEKKTQDEINALHDEIAASAHDYACSMIRARQKFIDYLRTTELTSPAY